MRRSAVAMMMPSMSFDVMEDVMNTLRWNELIQALVLIRIGQELGSDSRMAHAVHEFVQALISVWQ